MSTGAAATRATLEGRLDGSQPTLREGARGDAVTRLQERLVAHGCMNGDDPTSTDGAFGPRTRAAVARFQSDHGLESDGVVGPRTWAALQGAPTPARPDTATGTAPGPADTARARAWPPTPRTGAIPLNDGNSMRPGNAASTAPLADLSSLAGKGYRLLPVGGLAVLNSAASQGPDASLSRQRVGPSGYDAVVNGTFYFGGDPPAPTAAVMRDGRLDTSGVEKTHRRAGVAVLRDGSVVVGRMDGGSAASVQARYGATSPVKDFMGGGALLVEDGRKVSGDDLLSSQRFDQGGGGINAQQMRRTDHTLIGIRDGQAYVVGANNKSGAQVQDDLVAAGFDAVVKFDGGSGSYFRDGNGTHYDGFNPVGFGVHARR